MPSRFRTLLHAATLLAALVAAPAAHAAPGWTPPISLGEPFGTAGIIVVAGEAPGTAVAVWADQAPGPVTRLRATLRTGGTTSAPITLSTEAVSPEDIDGTAAGRAAFVGLRANPNNTQDLLAFTSDAPGVWGPAATLATDVSQQQEAHLAMNPAGTAAAVWTEFTGGKVRAMAAVRHPGEPWGAPATLSEQMADAAMPDVAVLPDGRVVAVFQQDVAGLTHLVSTIRDSAGTWSAPADVTAGEVAHEAPVLAANDTGGVIVLWHAPVDMGGNQLVRASALSGTTWGPAETVRSGKAPISDAGSLVIDDAGRASAFLAAAGDGKQLELVRRDAGGTWSTAGATARPATAPEVVAGRDGAVTTAWAETGDFSLHAGSPAGGSLGDTPLTTGATSLALDADGAGDVLLAYTSGPDAMTQAPALRVLDGTPPAVDAAVPAGAVAGRPADLSAAVSDAWSAPGPVTWSFGDGTMATGAQVAHAWAGPGTYTVTVTGADAVGNTASVTRSIAVAAAPPGGGAPPADRTAPVMRKLSLTRTRRLKVTLSEPAQLTVTIERRKGRRWVALKPSIRLKAKKGAQTLRLKRKLKPGRYRLRVVAIDAAGNRSRPSKRIPFRVTGR